MDNDELKQFLEKLLPEQDGISENDIDVFRKLSSLTIEYRNKLKAEKKKTLTVGEVRVAIELYWIALEQNRKPNSGEPRIEELVRIWLLEINNLTY